MTDPVCGHRGFWTNDHALWSPSSGAKASSQQGWYRKSSCEHSGLLLLPSSLHSGCLEGRPRPQCTSRLRTGRPSCRSCTSPSPILAGSHLVRALLSWASSRSRFSEMEQLLALPKVVCSLRMPFSRPFSPYSLSPRCVSRAWVMVGTVLSIEGNKHGTRGDRVEGFLCLFSLGCWVLRFRTLEALPCPENSAHSFCS